VADPNREASSADTLSTPLQFLKGVGPRRAADLARVGLATVEDLLHRFPIRYEDRGRLRPIAQLKPGETASISGEILSASLRVTRRPGFKIFEALVRDATGSIRATWLNQPFLRDVLKPHQRVVLYGSVELRPSGGLQLLNPQYEPIEEEDGETVHTGRIVPIYEKAGSLTPKLQRRLVHDALERLPPDVEDPLPVEVRDRLGLPDRHAALWQTHFPPAHTDIGRLNAFRTPAQQRLILEEFFLFQTGQLLRRRATAGERKLVSIRVDDRIRASVRAVLPFRLTAGQKQALKEIVDDMRRSWPMNRLLQGDVGAGKTIVALIAALVAMENGLQVAFMAPTEILAEQHFLTIRSLLTKARFPIGVLTGSMPAADRRDTLHALQAGHIKLVVGTHALVQEDVTFQALGLAVIDEQHRFGVLQRATLRAKGLHPDVLVMTATPIPRTLALTSYGDLDVSVIRDLPPGRKPVKTVAKPETRRDEVWTFVSEQLAEGRQAYIVYPLVEESDKIDLKAATEMADHLASEIFPSFKVALLHGRMPQEAKDRVMRAFAAGDLHVLVSTTVIEVGVDVANASVMLVEHAERFGLSQLHQLRGRVGRGRSQSYCVLLYQAPLSDQARGRLKAMTETNDGFVIAERDLELRGPGDFFGTRQSGVPTLRIGDLLRDRDLMETARAEASRFLDRAPAIHPLFDLVRRAWSERFGLVGVG
jgi:ATP-dependent DNA helicase RecG